jgi:inhibitor of cysteine peptidase
MAPKRPQLAYLQKRVVFIYALTFGLFLLFLSSCGNQTITMLQTDNGKSVQAHAGDTIVIQLDENASTGYTWAVNKTDTTVLMLQSSTYTSTGNLPGSGGTRVFTFLAKNPGTVQLQLKYWRSFVGDASITERYSVTIEVQK